jgi:GPN-loop GTPase
MSSVSEEKQEEQMEGRTSISKSQLISVQNDSATGMPPVIGRIERKEQMPICIIFVGMAGSGKSSLVTQLQSSLDKQAQDQDEQYEEFLAGQLQQQQQQQVTADDQPITDQLSQRAEFMSNLPKVPYAYGVNLDPATINVSFDASIDIRDTISYKQVMQQHKLGPNGAILTSLNLFATKFDQVMNILEQRAYGSTSKVTDDTVAQGPNDCGEDEGDDETMDYILVDTPGQIEAFTWSASGSMMSEALASAFPTVLCFVIDTPRCATSPNTFMSNMLYACSMLYRTKLPLVICFNKIDVVSHESCLEWMRDCETFQQALDDTAESSGFYGSLTRSLSLVLEEFYTNFANACGVSAYTGDGIDEFWITVQKAAQHDFCLDYIDDLKNRIEEQLVRKQALARVSAQRLRNDLANLRVNDDEDDA